MQDVLWLVSYFVKATLKYSGCGGDGDEEEDGRVLISIFNGFFITNTNMHESA
jgi:hypothetical protein